MLSTKVNSVLWRPLWRHISTSPQLLRSNKDCEQKGGGIRDKAGLITGGASGIGLQCARALLKCGARGVTIADCDNDRGEAALKELAEEFGNDKAVFVHCDVTKSELVDWAFKTTLNAFNRLDIVINSAGVLNDRVWENEIHTNICGTMVGNLLGLQYMAAHCAGKGGYVVNICSTMGLSPFCGAPIYSMTQAAILGLTRALGQGSHLERTKVKVIGVAAGLTDTPLMVNATKNTINTRFSADFKKDLQGHKWQRPEAVANTVLAAIKDGEPGSMWVVEDGCKPYKICMPCYVDMKTAGKETVLECLLPPKVAKSKSRKHKKDSEGDEISKKTKVGASAKKTDAKKADAKKGEKAPAKAQAKAPPPKQPAPKPAAKPQTQAKPASKPPSSKKSRSKSHGSCGSCPEPKWHTGEPPKKEKKEKKKKEEECDACLIELKYKHKKSKAKKKKPTKPPLTKVKYTGKCKDKEAKGGKGKAPPPKGGKKAAPAKPPPKAAKPPAKPPPKAPAKPPAKGSKPPKSAPPPSKDKDDDKSVSELSFECECEEEVRKKRARSSAH